MNKEQLDYKGFMETHVMPYTRIIVGICLFVFMVIVTPLLTEKFIIDFRLLLMIGGGFIFSVVSIYLGYEGRDPIVLLVGDEDFAFSSENLSAMIKYTSIKSLTKISDTKMVCVYQVDEKEESFVFNLSLIRKDQRVLAVKALKERACEYLY